MKRLLVLFFVLFFTGMVYAVPAAVTIDSPLEGQVFTAGDEIELSFSTNVKMQAVWVSGSFNGNWIQLFYVSFPDDEAEEGYSYTKMIDSTGFPTGPAEIRVSPGYYENPDDLSSYHMIENEVNFVLTENPELITDDPVNVIRSVPEVVYPGGIATINLIVNPLSEFPGIILTEAIPEEIIYDFGPGLFPVQITEFEQEDSIKFVLMKKENIPFLAVYYQIHISNDVLPGDVIPLTGTWAIEGTEGAISGDDSLTIGGFVIPDCPFTDQQLLEFITDWAGNTITNNQMLQVIERWKECQDIPV
ncbi:hypothetical protein KKG83_07450 [Candidatus Micrarchaeota archaeon]|nr:hypothetical protein [Candidatus Micrarchaeota archaeon]MBU2477275.1 hypothetical protein [Candidatus Micrarchaeota archaeon]